MTRFLAALIDGFISSLVFFIPVIGAIICTAYLLIKDGLFEGQSLGKKLMKLQVVTLEGEKANFSISAKRNLIFAIPSFIAIIPALLWVIAPILSFTIMAIVSILSFIIIVIEVVKLLNHPKGRRLGDARAGTQVIKHAEGTQSRNI